jgi:hypothetical protein
MECRVNILSGKSGFALVAVGYNRAMAFSHEILLLAWTRSKGRCECRREGHGHGERCRQSLVWSLRGSDSTAGGWQIRRRTTWGTDVLANCEILCSACQRPPQPVRVR